MSFANRLGLLALLVLTACDGGTSEPASAVAAAKASEPAAVAAAEDKPTFVMYVQPDYPPLSMRGVSGEITGLDVDILKAIAAVEGFNIDVLPHPLHGILEHLETGKADIVSGIHITPERQAVFDFSPPYLETNYAFFVKNGKSIADLQGQPIAVEQGGAAESQLRNSAITDKIIPTKTMYLAFSEMKQDNAAGMYGVEAVLQNYIKQYPGHSIIDDDKGGKVQFGFVMVKDNLALKGKLEKGFAAIRANGTYRQIINKWLDAAASGESAGHKHSH